MAAIQATDVSRTYGKQEVLKGLSLTVEAGRFVALMGPSGSGKSTFLHLAAGLLAADFGSILVGGEDVTKMSDAAVTKFRRRHVGVVFQSFNLLEEKTVQENILLPLVLDGVRANTVAQGGRFSELVARLGLAPLLKKRPQELSGGEQQRVALARALIAEPEIVLADEPTGNLDAQAAKEVCAILKSLNAGSKTAMLVVTHDPQVAACAETVCFLKDGRLAATHTTEGSAARVSQLYLETFA